MTRVSSSFKPSAQAGFSLLEIIVVVAIIGIMVAVIGVSMSGDSDRLARLESHRFQMIVNEVRDEAVLSGQSFFLELDEKALQYRFNAAAGNTSDFELLKARKLEPGVDLRWQVLEEVVWGDEEDQNSRQVPRALISPLGEITPFVAEFVGDELSYEVFIDERNQLARREKNAISF